jgi:hypothetical protein
LAEATGEIAGGAKWKEPDHCVITELRRQQPADDFAHRAIASRDDDAFNARSYALSSNALGVPGGAGKLDVERAECAPKLRFE